MMRRLRPPKPRAAIPREWRCCGCVHVRAATIALGAWHLTLHALALVLLATIAREPDLLERLRADATAPAVVESAPPPPRYDALPTPLSAAGAVEAPPPYAHRRHRRDLDAAALVTLCTLAINATLVYGAVRGRAAHLLPFFCLQLFDFAITALTATGYLCYARAPHRLVAESRNVPWRAQLLRLDREALTAVVLGSFLGAVLVKAYCINVVWRCYKYLTMRQFAAAAGGGGALEAGGEAAFAAAALPPPPPPAPLPDYEEAVKMAAPPPSYQAATAHLLEARPPPVV